MSVSVSDLSPRERQCAGLLLLDLPDKLIGARLGLSRETVKAHLRSARRKLDCETRVGLALRVAGVITQKGEMTAGKAGERIHT